MWAVLGWWNDVLGRGAEGAEGLCCHAARAGALSHAGSTGAGMCVCLCLYLLLLLSVELGLGRERARHSLPGLSTYRYYLWRGDDGVHILPIVLLQSAAQQAWLPMETSIYLKKRIPIIHAGIFQRFFFSFQWKICETARSNKGWFCSGVLIVLKISIFAILEV